MKIVVVGGTGLIGSQLIKKLQEKGHEATAVSRKNGVNILTGEGLAQAFKGAAVVVDVSNSPSFEDQAVLEFFQTSTRNLLRCEQTSGVTHHIALSVVGTDQLQESGYFRAKLLQENLIKTSGIPYTIVRATQFFEFIKQIAESSLVGDTLHVPEAFIQPIASEDVAESLAQTALQKPKNGILDIAGPKRFQFSEIAQKYLNSNNDPRKIISDTEASYFGTKIQANTLVPQGDAWLGSSTFESWLNHTQGVNK